MKKVLFMIPNLLHGGAEKVLVNLVNNMNRNEYDITVLTLFDTGVNKQFLKDHIHYKYCFKHMFRGNSHILKLFYPKQLYKLFIKDDYDIIVSYLEGPTARIVSGCTNKNTKLVSWIHVQQTNSKIASKAFRSYKEALQCYQRFDNTICVSEAVKNDFLSIYPLKKKCMVLYNTNETELIKEQSKEIVNDITINDNSINICGVGKLLPNKGFDRLLRVHKRLIDEGFDIHTYILGVGTEQKKLENYIKDNKLDNSCTLLGYKVNPYKYVSKFDLFTCTSYAEGFSTAATEALIVGTPVLTMEVAGMKEMLGINNEYGIIVDNDEEEFYKALKGLLLDKELLQHYKNQALIRGSFFSTENTVKAVEEMFINLMNTEK